jgi:hypothetical protein
MQPKECQHCQISRKLFVFHVPGHPRTIKSEAMQCLKCGKIMMTYRQKHEFKEECEVQGNYEK